MIKKLFSVFALSSVLGQSLAHAEVFDHTAWDQLLKAHVAVNASGSSTVVDYHGMRREREKLTGYLLRLSQVETRTFESWQHADQLAFLINVYNSWTVELILTAWPNIASIKELGSFFNSPWSKVFIPLFGSKYSLDDIEHDWIRGKGRYNEPRIHFAVNCASIGCPALRNEAFTGNLLEQQLDEQTRLFLSDVSRNRVMNQTLQISSIFKWYREDFEKGWSGYHRLVDFLLDYAQALQLSAEQKLNLKTGKMDVEFLAYDWQLNAS